MAEVITKTKVDKSASIQQCDIFRDVEFIEYAQEFDETIEISKIVFPYVIVLTQACDLQQDFKNRVRLENDNEGNNNHDKLLFSSIVAPIYNYDEFLEGKHLSQLGLSMSNIGKKDRSPSKNIMMNENKRYHYLKFSEDVKIVESVIDFKHYFTVNQNYLNKLFQNNYVCSVESVYREFILQRFSNFLSRIGLPDPE